MACLFLHRSPVTEKFAPSKIGKRGAGGCGCGTLRGARNLASATLRSFLSSLSSLTLEEIIFQHFH